MKTSSMTPRDLEHILCDETAEPTPLPLSLLREITDGFSDEQRIGSGGFAVVYKGKLKNRTMAVKKMSNAFMDEMLFHREVQCLMLTKHTNIVRFIGYCADRQGIMEKYEGKLVMADVHERLLCFEYLPRGSLHEYITDTSRELQWRDRFRIITGICHGLHYLHQKNIVHVDLKPANILLDNNLVAKIADFGLSRCFGETQTRTITKNIRGTFGYFPPEFGNGEITYQFDIFSLGVIILEILTGKKGYHDVDKVVESWIKLLEQSHREVQLEQVRVCAEIGIECIDSNPTKRPNMRHIVNRLEKIKTMDGYIETGVISSQQAEDGPNDQHYTPNTSRDTTSKESITIAEVGRTGPLLRMLNKEMESLNPDIRRCLEYCSIFPRGSKLRRDDLVRLWIAQGFVKTTHATDDMEDIADEYIQELVACSFLQPIGTNIDSFTIHEVLHGILDKVAENCFRIENERSHEGEGWEGDVPGYIQHIFIQNYDGELIIEKIIGLEYLRTLIVYVVGKDTPIEEEVIDTICKRLPKLRVLAVAFSPEHHGIRKPIYFSFPESIGQLKYLRYLAFRTDFFCKIALPSTLNKLQHIQLLDFGNGIISEFTFAALVNLRHIFCNTFVKLPYIGRLISLQTLPDFTVSNEQGCELKQLRDLEKIRGKLFISGLENAKSKEEALQANLAAKHLTELSLMWGIEGCSPKVQADVLEGLCPPVGLQMLELCDFEGWRYLDWMVGKHSSGPKHLQGLILQGCNQLVPPSGFAEAFPHLCVLYLFNCEWDALPSNMAHLTSLKTLVISGLKNIRSLSSLPQSLQELTIYGCNDEFMKSCKKVGHPNWEKIEHIAHKNICWPAKQSIRRSLAFQGGK